MGKSSPKAPEAPDPVATAKAQADANIATANAQANLNRVNQNTPWGSQTYTQGTPNADGTANWTLNTTLDPAQQKLLDSSNALSQGMAEIGQRQLGNVNAAIGAANPTSSTQVQNNPLQSSVNMSGIPKMQTSAQSGNIQNSIDMSKVPELVGGDALRGTMLDNQRAAYNLQSQYLDKNYAQREHDMENKLIQQGVLQGSDAWNREMQNLGQQRTFDYNNAFNNSFDKGLSAQGQLYNQGLASNQNAYYQALNNGQFANAAQQQGYGQSANNAALNNSVASNLYAQGLSGAQLNNQAAGQAFNQSSAQRANELQEGYAAQQNPINILSALRNGSQVTTPQFGSTPGSNIAPTDIASLYNQQYQAGLAQYNGQIANNNSTQQGIVGLAAAAATAY